MMVYKIFLKSIMAFCYQMENASGYTAEDKLVSYWSPTEEGLHYGYVMEFHHYTQNVKVAISLKHWGYSVRCVKD